MSMREKPSRHVDEGDAGREPSIVLRGAARFTLDGHELLRRSVDGLPERGVGEPSREVPHDDAVEPVIVRSGAQGSVHARRDGALGVPMRVSMARASSSQPGYGSFPPRIHLAALARPSKSVWHTMVSSGPTRSTSGGIDHLGARAVFGLGRKDEARVVAIARVLVVIVVIDPDAKPLAERRDERQRDVFEAAAFSADACEGDVEHADAPRK